MTDGAWSQNPDPSQESQNPQEHHAAQTDDLDALLDESTPQDSSQKDSDTSADISETSESEADDSALTKVESSPRGRRDEGFSPTDLMKFWNFGVAFQTATDEWQELFRNTMAVNGDVVSVGLALLEPYHRTTSVEGILSLVKTDLDKSESSSAPETFMEVAAKFQRGEITMEEFTKWQMEREAGAERRGEEKGSDYERRKSDLAAYETSDMRALVRMFNSIGQHYLDDYANISYRRNMDHDELVSTLEGHVEALPDAGVEFIQWSLEMLNSWPNVQGRG